MPSFENPEFRHPIGHPDRVSIVVPVWNGLAWTRDLLATLVAEAIAEIIIVDNGSTDGTGAWLAAAARKDTRLHPIRLDHNTGFAAGCNQGILATTGEFVLVLNNDTRVAPAMIDRLLFTWHRVPHAGLVAPLSNWVKGRQLLRIEPAAEAQNTGAIEQDLRQAYGGGVEEVDSLAGLCLLARRSFFQQVGLFDPGYGIGNFEDDDLCIRTRLAGLRLLIARDAYLWHAGSRTFEALGVDYAEHLLAQERLHDAKWAQHPLVLVEQSVRAATNGDAGDKERAIRFAREQLDRYDPDAPETSWLQRALAQLLEAADRHDEALDSWRCYLTCHSFDPDARCRYALGLLWSGSEAEGRRQFSDAIRSRSLDRIGCASLLNLFARWSHEHGYLDDAVESLGAALAIADDFAPAWNTQAVWHLQAEEYSSAEACLLPFAERDDPDILTNLAIVWAHRGRLADARSAFARASALAGPGSSAAKNLALLEAQLAPETRSLCDGQERYA